MSPSIRYWQAEAELRRIADQHFTHPKHLCADILTYPPEVQEPVFKLLNEQLKLLVLINRQTPIPFRPGK